MRRTLQRTKAKQGSFTSDQSERSGRLPAAALFFLTLGIDRELGPRDGLQPSFAHGMALRLAQKGAIQDVVTEHFNSNMSSQEAAKRLAQAVQDSM